MHHTLLRQLQKLGLTENTLPEDSAQWQSLLACIDTAYKQADDDIGTLKALKKSDNVKNQKIKKLNGHLSKLASFPEDNVGPVMRFDKKKTLIYANLAAKKILHRLEISNSKQATGELSKILDNALHENNLVTQELEIDNHTFLIRFISVTSSTTPSNKYVNVYGTDISVQKKFEKKLIIAKDTAIQSSRAKSEFLAMMSHEIRTPMNGVIGMSELLLTTPLESKQQRYTNNIIKSSQALLRIIDDILDISKIDANKLELESTEFSLIDFTHEFSELFLVPLTEKNLVLDINIAADIPHIIRADSTRLRQILVNLIGNAIKFTDKGAIQLNLSLTNQNSETNTLHFEVIDQGIGIEEIMCAHIFDSFTQADQSTTRLYGGTGLGLAIVQRLVHMMHGEVGVDSKRGQGSRFWFTVRLPQNNIALNSIKQKNIRSQQADESIKATHQNTETRRVLLVEDNILNQEVATEMLELFGFQVDVVNNGKKAIAAVRKQKYNLIFMDCQMPEMDGYEATRQIRQLERYIKFSTPVPIIAITANAMNTDSEKCKMAGMDDFLSKPFSINRLESIIQTYQHSE